MSPGQAIKDFATVLALIAAFLLVGSLFGCAHRQTCASYCTSDPDEDKGESKQCIDFAGGQRVCEYRSGPCANYWFRRSCSEEWMFYSRECENEPGL